jgi:hypothetical protein
MSVTARLVYNTADDSASSKVGAHVLAGDDGTQIGHVADALKVNFSNTSIAVTATDLDIRDLTQADEITVFQGTSPWVIGDGGGSITVDGTVAATQSGSWTVSVSGDVNVTQGTSPWVVSATDLDIRDLSHLAGKDSVQLGDGTDLITSTLSGGKQALDVYIANAGSIDVDDSLANTAIFCEARAVSTSEITLTAASAIAGRKWLYMANIGNKGVFIGPNGVTASSGYPCFPGQQSEYRIGAAVAVKVIGAAGASSEDIRVMQLS